MKVKYVCEDCGKEHPKAFIDKLRGATQDTDLTKIPCVACRHRTIILVEPDRTDQMKKQGERIAWELDLRPASHANGEPFNPPRYHMCKNHGSKTAVGVLTTILRLAADIPKDLK